MLKPIPIHAELERHPTEHSLGLQQQPVDRLTKHRARATGPGLALNHGIDNDPRFVVVQLDQGSCTGGQGPLAIVLVDQVLLTVALGQRNREFGHQVGRCTASRNRKRKIFRARFDSYVRQLRFLI